MTTTKNTPVETLSPKQVSWLKANGIAFEKNGRVPGYFFSKNGVTAWFDHDGFDVDTADHSEDGDGVKTFAWGLSLRDALKKLLEVA